MYIIQRMTQASFIIKFPFFPPFSLPVLFSKRFPSCEILEDVSDKIPYKKKNEVFYLVQEKCYNIKFANKAIRRKSTHWRKPKQGYSGVQKKPHSCFVMETEIAGSVYRGFYNSMFTTTNFCKMTLLDKNNADGKSLNKSNYMIQCNKYMCRVNQHFTYYSP